jgi:26S proteasome regulatory subunit N9
VVAVNEGDIDKFNAVMSAESSQYASQPALVRDHEAIKQKVVLVALMNLVYDKPAHARTIAYSEIASKVRIPLDQVDWVLMRSLSLGLIKGQMNQVEQKINVTWVQPKVLNIDQIKGMEGAMEEWSQKVKGTLSFVSDQTAEIFA